VLASWTVLTCRAWQFNETFGVVCGPGGAPVAMAPFPAYPGGVREVGPAEAIPYAGPRAYITAPRGSRFPCAWRT
jgi:hypothetical protein